MRKATSRLRQMLMGSSFVSLDDRSRLILPARVLPNLRLLSGLAEGEELEVAVTVSLVDRCIAIYPIPIIEDFVAKLEQAPLDAEVAIRQRMMLRKYFEYQEVDKQGRLKLPPVLLELFKLQGEVVLVGAEDHLQLWPKEEGLALLKDEIAGSSARTNEVLKSDWMQELNKKSPAPLPT